MHTSARPLNVRGTRSVSEVLHRLQLRGLGLLLLLALAACGSGGGDEAQASAFESAAGKFSAEFPAEPQEDTQSQSVAGLNLDLHIFTAESDDYAVSVAYVDYPAEIASVDPRSVLGGAAGGASGNLPGGEITKSEFGKFAGVDSIDYEVAADGIALQAKAFLVGARLYQLQAVSERLADADAEYDRLVETFKLQ